MAPLDVTDEDREEDEKEDFLSKHDPDTGEDEEDELEQGKGEADDDDRQTPEPDEDAEGEIDEDELAEARSALRRDGWTREALERLDDATIIAIGHKRRKNQGDVDQMAADLRALRSGQATDSGDPGHAEPTPADPKSLPASVQKVVTSFSEQFGEETGPLLGQLYQAARVEVQKDMGALTDLVAELMEDAARTRLAERIPELADDAVYQKIQKRTRDGVNAGTYRDRPSLQAQIQESMEDAAWAVLRGKLGKTRKEMNGKESRRRLRSQPSSQSTNARKRKLSEDELSSQLLDKLERKHQVRHYDD
jgi:hypothetical protein